jgi:UDP-N-acetylmuramate--alanine ligase
VAGATVVDDYAHNPAKVAAVIDAARTYAPARVVVCFQPHLYSRTAASAHAFGGALAGADEVVVTEIYPARERPVAGVTAKLVVDALSERRPGMPLAYMPQLDDAAGYLRARVRAGDLVLTVGAGDVRRVGDDLLR